MTTLHGFYKENRFNPTTFELSSSEALSLHQRRREELYVGKLCIPNLVWRNARVLEVGCSSGENSLLYAQMGARLTLVEPVEDSLARLSGLFRRHDRMDSIDRVYEDIVENVEFEGEFDLIVAEGFLNTLEKRADTVRKLFEALSQAGLLILSTNDAVGSFLECFKALVAQLYCRRRGIDGLDNCVEAIRPFFEGDFESIPHARSFAQWAKDVLLNPILGGRAFYDFDEIVADLDPLNPAFYSSWPSYGPVNDLLWHRYVVDNRVRMKQMIDGYYLRRPSFLLGEVLPLRETVRSLAGHDDSKWADEAKPTVHSFQHAIDRGSGAGLGEVLLSRASESDGRIREVFLEMAGILSDLTPSTYSGFPLVRKCWGVPYHYIVFSRNGQSSARGLGRRTSDG